MQKILKNLLTSRYKWVIIIKLLKITYEPLAQLAEHLTFNQGARGSNPRWLTKKKNPDKAHEYAVCGVFLYPFLGLFVVAKVRKKH